MSSLLKHVYLLLPKRNDRVCWI